MSHFDPACSTPGLLYREPGADPFDAPDATSLPAGAMPLPEPEAVPVGPRWTPRVLPGGAAAAEAAALAIGETGAVVAGTEAPAAVGLSARLGAVALESLGWLSTASVWLPLLLMKGDPVEPPVGPRTDGETPPDAPPTAWPTVWPRPSPTPMPTPDAGIPLIPLEPDPSSPEAAPDAGAEPAHDAGASPARELRPLPHPGNDAGTGLIDPGGPPDGGDTAPAVDAGVERAPILPRAHAAAEDEPERPTAQAERIDAPSDDAPDAPARIERDPSLLALDIAPSDALFISVVAGIADGDLKADRELASQAKIAIDFDTRGANVGLKLAALERLGLLAFRAGRYVVTDPAASLVAGGIADRVPLQMRTRLKLDALSAFASGQVPDGSQLSFSQMASAFATSRQSVPAIVQVLQQLGLIERQGPQAATRFGAQRASEALLSGALRHFRPASPKIVPWVAAPADVPLPVTERSRAALREDHPLAPAIVRTRLLSDLVSGRLSPGQALAEPPGADLDAALASLSPQKLFVERSDPARLVVATGAWTRAMAHVTQRLSALPGNAPAEGDVDLEFLRDAAIRARVTHQLTGRRVTSTTNVQDLRREFHAPAARVRRVLDPWVRQGLLNVPADDGPIRLASPEARAALRQAASAQHLYRPPVPRHHVLREAAAQEFRTRLLVDILDRVCREGVALQPLAIQRRMIDATPVDAGHAMKELKGLGILDVRPRDVGQPQTVVTHDAVRAVKALLARASGEPHGSPLHRLFDLTPVRAAVLRSDAIDRLIADRTTSPQALARQLSREHLVSEAWATRALQPLFDRLTDEDMAWLDPAPPEIESPRVETVAPVPPLPPLMPAVRQVALPLNEIDLATVLTVQALADGSLPAGRWFTSAEWAAALGVLKKNVRQALQPLKAQVLESSGAPGETLQSLNDRDVTGPVGRGFRAKPAARDLAAQGQLHRWLSPRGEAGLQVLSAVASGQLQENSELDIDSFPRRLPMKGVTYGLRALARIGVLAMDEGAAPRVLPGAREKAQALLEGPLKPFRVELPRVRARTD